MLKPFMNRVRFYIIFFIFLLGFCKSYAQELILSQKFSFRFNHQPIEAVLDNITRVTGLSFSYTSSILNNVSPITATYNQMPLIDILEDIFYGKKLNFKQVCSYIAITRKVAGDDSPDIFSFYTDSTEYFYLKARIIDGSNKKPVPFANVVLKRKNIGTISNGDGNFTLKIPPGCFNDTMVVSFIGYKTVSTSVSALSTGENIILEPFSTQLKEVIVNHFEPKTLIKMAIENVPNNYSPNPELQVGFYRETSQQNKDYVVISEAVLKILKAAYNRDYKTDQVIVYKSRKSPLVKSMDTVLYKLQGGIYNSLMIDLAKYSASFMSEDFQNMYNYSFDGMTQLDDKLVYVVSFDQKPEVDYPLYKGKLYIDKESLAFVNAEFGISPLGLKYATGQMVKKTTSKLNAKVLEANYLVSYSNTEGVWRLHHVREEIRIRIRKKFSFFNSTYHSVSELVITDSDTTSITRFKNAEIVKQNHVFAEVSNNYDESFWGKFNFIQPEVSLEEAYSKIKNAFREKNSKY